MPRLLISLLAIQQVFALTAPAFADDGKWKPTDNCKELNQRLPNRLLTVMRAHPQESQLIALGLTMTAGFGLMGAGLNSTMKGFEQQYAAKYLSNASIYDDVAQRALGDLITDTQLTIEEVIAQSSRKIIVGRISTIVGSSLAGVGLLGLVAETLTSGTDPLHAKVVDDPTLLVHPEKVEGGKVALCTAYHFEGEKMKLAEDKLVKNFEDKLIEQENQRKYFAIYRRNHPEEFDGTVKQIAMPIHTMSSDKTSVQPTTVIQPK